MGIINLKGFAERYFFWIIFFLMILFLIIAGLTFYRMPGSQENIQQYYISRYGFFHPDLLFHDTLSPVFVLLSSLFSQFGFWGFRVFGFLLGALICVIASCIFENREYSKTVFLFVFFIPLFLRSAFINVPDLLFGLFLISGIWLYKNKRFISSSLLFSFLPLLGLPGLLCWIIYFAVFMVRHHYRAIPWFLTGFILAGIAGSFFHRSFFWVFNSWLDTLNTETFKDTGSFFYLLRDRYFDFGVVIMILFLAGIMASVNPLFHSEKERRSESLDFFILVFVPFTLVFLLLSYMSMMGMSEPAENVRMLSTFLPLAGLIAFNGFILILGSLFNKPGLRTGFIIITGLGLTGTGIAGLKTPPVTHEEKIFDQTREWLMSEKISARTVYYTNPLYAFHAGQDLSFRSGNTRISGYRELKDIPEGDIFIWDCRFGPLDCGIPLASLISQGNFRLIRVFSSIEKFDTLNTDFYETFIFKKQPCRTDENLDFLRKQGKLTGGIRVLEKFGFEKPGPQVPLDNLSRDFVYRGKYSYQMSWNSRFSPGLVSKFSRLSDHPENLILRVSMNILPITGFNDNSAEVVLSVDSGKEAYFFQSIPLEQFSMQPWHWNFVNIHFYITGIQSVSDNVKCYILHEGDQRFYIGNMLIELIRPGK